MNVNEEAKKVVQDVIEWRHHFHKHPELSFREVNTTAKIAEILREIGYTDIQIGFTDKVKTGLVAKLNYDKPGKALVFRADIDALPIEEQADVEYKSINDGVMHACGHDAHISTMLGVAKLCFNNKDEINGPIKFLFQPAEEAPFEELTGTEKTGAYIIVNETDFMDDVAAVVGMHVWSTVDSGVIGYKPGPFMTTNAVLNMEIEGVGGHGAMPHTTKDPVIPMTQIISGWQTIVSREADPLEMVVITVGKIETNGAWNIIGDKVKMVGGVRTLNQSLIENVTDRMSIIAKSYAEAHGCKATLKFDFNAPPVINDPEFTKDCVRMMSRDIDAEFLQEIPPFMPSEDFAYFQEKVPGLLFYLGVGDESKQTHYAQHHPKYKVDDDALVNGLMAFGSIANQFFDK